MATFLPDQLQRRAVQLESYTPASSRVVLVLPDVLHRVVEGGCVQYGGARQPVPTRRQPGEADGRASSLL
jgi:hypothetical protein